MESRNVTDNIIADAIWYDMLTTGKWASKFPYWNICDECAKSNGGVSPGTAVTVTRGKCPYCKQENVILTPTDDFRWPGESKEAYEARWD